MSQKIITRILLISFVFFLLAFALAMLVAYDSRNYVPRPVIVFVRQPVDTLEVWQKHKVRGRTLLYIGKKLPLRQPLLQLTADADVNLANLDKVVNADKITVSNDDYLYSALLKGIYRKLVWVVPEVDWSKKEIFTQYYRLSSSSHEEKYVLLEGSPLIVCTPDALSTINESCLIHVETKDMPVNLTRKIIEALKKKGVRSDLITVSSRIKDGQEIKSLPNELEGLREER